MFGCILLIRVSDSFLEEMLRSIDFLGWVLAGLLCGGWFFHVRWVRKSLQKEIDRMAEQKKFLQEILQERKLPSSKKNK